MARNNIWTKNIWTQASSQMHKASMLSAILFASGILTAPAAYAGAIKEVVTSESSILVKFDDVVNKASVFTLAGPNRIALDILGATKGSSARVKGPFSQIRQGQFDPNTARVVFDLARPALVTGGKFAADGRSLRINLRSAQTSEFSTALGRGRVTFTPPALFRSKPPKKNYEVSAKIKRTGTKKGLPRIYGPSNPKLPLVVIDAGHGGHDPGAISPHGGKREKEVTLAIAKSIRDELVKSGRIRVALTRETDKFLVLQDRFGVARRMNADLFISVHADAAGSEQANGATVYTLSEVASDREAQRLAARENKSNIINGINLGGADASVSSILIDLTQRETMNVSADFAKILIREAKPNMRLRSNSHRFASFVVLKAPDTPSVLFETGYLTNERDVKFLASREGQRKVGKSVSSAVQVHFARKLASR